MGPEVIMKVMAAFISGLSGSVLLFRFMRSERERAQVVN